MKFSNLLLATLLSSTLLFGANNRPPKPVSEPLDITLLSEEYQMALEELLQRKIDIESQSHLGRIIILEDAENCIQTIETLEDYHACEKTEALARKTLREDLRDDKKALRDDFRALISEIRSTQEPAS